MYIDIYIYIYGYGTSTACGRPTETRSLPPPLASRHMRSRVCLFVRLLMVAYLLLLLCHVVLFGPCKESGVKHHQARGKGAIITILIIK